MTNDPDLMQAIEDLQHVVARIRQLESQVRDAINDTAKYDRLAAAKQDRADMHDRVRARAERLNLPARALMLIVEEYWRLKGLGKKKPTAGALEVAIATALKHAQTAENEAFAELEFARMDSARAAARSTAATDALKYLRAA